MLKDFCSDHKCMKDKLDLIRADRTFWHRIWESKWTFWIITTLVVAFITFNSWVTTEILAQRSVVKSIENLCSDIDEIKTAAKSKTEKDEQEKRTREQQREQDKKDMKQDLEKTQKELKEDNARRDAQRERDQREVVRMLMEIQRQIKSK